MFRWVHLEIVCFVDYGWMGTFGKLCVMLIVEMGTFGNTLKEGGNLQRSL
jgi:hypothetical protein